MQIVDAIFWFCAFDFDLTLSKRSNTSLWTFDAGVAIGVPTNSFFFADKGLSFKGNLKSEQMLFQTKCACGG